MSEEDEKSSKWKDRGLTAGGTVLALFVMQEKGVNLISDKYEVKSQMVLEKTIQNADRINKLEERIEASVTSLRSQIRSEFLRLDNTIRGTMENRWSKNDQNEYSKNIDLRIRRIEEDILRLERKTKDK